MGMPSKKNVSVIGFPLASVVYADSMIATRNTKRSERVEECQREGRVKVVQFFLDEMGLVSHLPIESITLEAIFLDRPWRGHFRSADILQHASEADMFWNTRILAHEIVENVGGNGEIFDEEEGFKSMVETLVMMKSMMAKLLMETVSMMI